MGKMFVVNVHSLVDLITNSSTELFVLDTEKSLEVVKEILVEAINLNNKTKGTSEKFEDIFEELRIGNGNSALVGWGDYYKSKISKGIIIMGVGDNSIPWWMFNFIESVFGYDTERFHLG